MDDQSVVVCDKHNKSESNLSLILSNYYVCMNRYCPDAYKVLCSACKTDHRDHAIKILNIEDLAFLIDRMLKMPFRQAGTFIIESVEVLKRLKLVYEFSNKITKILTELQHETLDLISMTEKIIAEYSQCKNSAIELSEAIYDFESKEAFEIFKNTEIKKLQRLDFNPQKDKLEYGNLEIKEKEDVRKKNLSYVRRKIEEVKEYSMKIIEVILNADESDEEEEDLMKKKKLYDALKIEIQNMCQNNTEIPVNTTDQPDAQFTQQNKKVETKSVSTETMKNANEDYEKKIKDVEKRLEIAILNEKRLENESKKYLSQLEVITNSQKKTDIEFKNKIMVLQKEKETLNKEKQNFKNEKEKVQKTMEQKIEVFAHYEKRLRDNFTKRNSRYKEREDIIKQLADLVEYQRRESRSKDNTSKENGEKGKVKS